MSTISHIEWQTRARMAYQWTEGQEIAGMHASLVARIDALIGRALHRKLFSWIATPIGRRRLWTAWCFACSGTTS